MDKVLILFWISMFSSFIVAIFAYSQIEKLKGDINNRLSTFKNDCEDSSKNNIRRIEELESYVRELKKEEITKELAPQIKELEKLSGYSVRLEFQCLREFVDKTELGQYFTNTETVYLDFPKITLYNKLGVYTTKELYTQEQLTNYINALKVEKCEKDHKKKTRKPRRKND